MSSPPTTHDDDNYDDLDDVLDQFEPPANKAPDSKDDDFAEGLARGMESLMHELGASSTTNKGEDTDGGERMLAWKGILEEINASTSRPADQTTTKPPTDFQSQIRDTIDKLKSSESSFKPPSPTQEQVDELARLFKGLGEEGANPDADQDADQDLTDALNAMMGQLMGKEVLHEPIKELHEKFPSYLESHPALSSEDRERYQQQILCMKRLLDIFEAPTYNEEDPETNKKVMDIMNELQAHGSPPEDIMGPLPPGFSLDPEGLPQIPDGCVVS